VFFVPFAQHFYFLTGTKGRGRCTFGGGRSLEKHTTKSTAPRGGSSWPRQLFRLLLRGTFFVEGALLFQYCGNKLIFAFERSAFTDPFLSIQIYVETEFTAKTASETFAPANSGD
jgi:hypothetical protein